MKFFALLTLVAFASSGCREAYVNLENAPVSRGNVNSVGATLGSVYLYDIDSGTATRINRIVSSYYPCNSGNYSQNASRNISISFAGNIPQAQIPSITAKISSLLEFSMDKFAQFCISRPDNALNLPDTVEFRQQQRAYADDDRYRFILITDAYVSDALNYKWDNQITAGTEFEVEVANIDVQVELNNAAAIKCSGRANVCLFTAQVFKLTETGTGATGLRFVKDTSLNSSGVIQRIFNGEKVRVN